MEVKLRRKMSRWPESEISRRYVAAWPIKMSSGHATTLPCQRSKQMIPKLDGDHWLGFGSLLQCWIYLASYFLWFGCVEFQCKHWGNYPTNLRIFFLQILLLRGFLLNEFFWLRSKHYKNYGNTGWGDFKRGVQN